MITRMIDLFTFHFNRVADVHDDADLDEVFADVDSDVRDNQN